MVTSCLSLSDLSCCFLFADLSLYLPAGLRREILHLLVWLISELCLAEGKQVEFLATVGLLRVGKSHLTHAVEHPWDDAIDQPQCSSDPVHHPWAEDLSWCQHSDQAVCQWMPWNCAPRSCLQPLLSFGAFFLCIGSYPLSTGCHAWLDLVQDLWILRPTNHTFAPPVLHWPLTAFSSPSKKAWESSSLLRQNRSSAEQRWALEAERCVWKAWEHVCPAPCCCAPSSFTKIAIVGKGQPRGRRVSHPSIAVFHTTLAQCLRGLFSKYNIIILNRIGCIVPVS